MNPFDFIIREDEAKYHARSAAGEYLSSHMLAEFRKSPFRYQEKLLGKTQESDKAEYAFGRAAHKLILEGEDEFERCYTVSDGPVNDRTGKPYGKETKAYQDWLSVQKGDVVTTSDYDKIRTMANSVATHPAAPHLTRYESEEGVAEGVVRAFYSGIPCQIRMDYFRKDIGIVDLKTCANIELFEVDARKYGYILQMAFYQAVLQAASGVFYPVHIIAVDKTDSAVCGVWQIPAVELEAASRINEAAIFRLNECREKGIFPTGFEQKRILTYNI